MTGSHQGAMERRLPILAEWKGQIKIARVGVPAPAGWQTKAAEAVRELRDFNRGRMLTALGDPMPMPSVPVEEIQQFTVEHPEWIEFAERLSDPATVKSLGGEIGVQKRMHAGFSKALVTLFNRKYKLTAAEQDELNRILSNPDTAKNYCPITPERLEDFKKFRTRLNIAQKTIDQQISKLKKLADFLESNNRKLDFESISDWLGSMELTSKTLTQYILAGNIFWEWALKYDKNWKRQYENSKNPFHKHDLPRARGKAKADNMRKAFEMSDLKKIYNYTIKEGMQPLADMIMLGLYTGARIEEICRIRAEHIVYLENIRFIDIPDSKTVAGIREVPVHPLIDDLVTRLSANTQDGYLISSASKNKYGIRSDAISKAFGRLKTKLGYGPELVFHSIRATFITQLHRGGVSGPVIAEIAGHETGTVTFDVYNHGASAKQKHEAILKIPKMG